MRKSRWNRPTFSLLLAVAAASTGCSGGEPDSADTALGAATLPLKQGAGPTPVTVGGSPKRILVKVRGPLGQSLKGAARSTTGDVDLSVARAASPTLSTLVEQHGMRGARALYPARLRRQEQQGLSDAQLTEATRRRFSQRAGRAPQNARVPELSSTYVLDVDARAPAAVTRALEALRADPDVVWAEEEVPVKLSFVPNDPRMSELHGLTKIGAPQAWDSARGQGVVVAVIDSGVDYEHPDIDQNLWTNPGEIPENGNDDDGNGFADDWRGWDFVSGDNDPLDTFGHGTHVAGTVAAEGDNATGVVGVAFGARIMPVRVFESLDVGGGFVEAIVYAADEGADVINASWGGPGPSQAYQDAVDYAHALGAVFVASAGNDSLDVNQHTPANVPNAIAVAAVDPTDARASFSNYGSKIDVAAPGVGILSLEAQTKGYVSYNGTSMAAPHVAGLAALVLQAHPEFSVEQVRQALRSTAVDLGAAGDDLVFGHGRINAAAAVQVTQVLEAKFAAPVDGAEIRAPVPLVATARGAGFARAVVEYGTGAAPTTWTQLLNTTAPTAVGGGTLATFDPRTLPDGLYTVRLRAISSANRTYTDQIQLQVRYAALTAPAPAPLPNLATELKPGAPVKISGRALGPSFRSYRLEWAPGRNATSGFSTAGITLTGNGTTPVESGVLGTWTPAANTTGDRTLRLTVVNSGFSSQAVTSVYLEPDLASPAWPQFVPFTAYDQGPLPVRGADGRIRFVLCSAGMRGAVCSLTTEAGANLNPIGLVRGAFWAPSAGALDGDAGDEVVFADHRRLVVTDADLALIREIQTPRAEGFGFDRTILSDLDGDGTAEIIALARDTDAEGLPLQTGSLHVYRGDGQLYSAAYPKPIVSSGSPAGYYAVDGVTADLNGDGQREIVLAVTNLDYSGYQLLALNADGSPVSGWPAPSFATGNTLNELSAADLDHDGRSEILIGENTATAGPRLRVLNSNGTTRPGWPVSGIGHYVAVGDLDRDQREEIIGDSFTNPASIIVLRADGSRFLTSFGPTLGMAGHPVVADVDGDAYPEVVVTDKSLRSENGVDYNDVRLRAISRTGAQVKEWRLFGSAGYQSFNAIPAIGEFTGDGRTDIAVHVPIIVGSADNGMLGGGGLTLLTTSRTYSAGSADWPLVDRDAQNSRSKPVSAVSCTPETNAQFCARLAKNCGAVSGTDNCGAARTVTSCGACTAPQTCGGGGVTNVCGTSSSAPCTGLCNSPLVFSTASYQSGNLGTAATCHQTAASLSGLVCGNFAASRSFRVNGVQVTCNAGGVSLPAKRNGGYCLQASAGDFAWAYFSTW